jgi:mannose-6-phosphate isomerase-like protein (cupin superfamily)
MEPDVVPFLPPVGGWRVFTLTIEPDTSPPVSMGAGQMPADLAAALAAGGGRGMHTTETVDVVIVLDGEASVELDDGVEVPLGTGEALVQLSSRHAWRNHSAHPATIAVMMAGRLAHSSPAALIPTPRPSGPRTQVHDIISNMSQARFTEILTDACNDTFTDGIAFMVGALTAEANGGVR